MSGGNEDETVVLSAVKPTGRRWVLPPSASAKAAAGPPLGSDVTMPLAGGSAAPSDVTMPLVAGAVAPSDATRGGSAASSDAPAPSSDGPSSPADDPAPDSDSHASLRSGGRHRRRSAGGGTADRVRLALGVTGELLITMGLVVLLFVVYEVYVTDWMSAGKQRNATAALDEQWSGPGTAPADPGDERTETFRPGDGEGFAKLYVPAFGSDFVFTILEGTTDAILETGPGHYKQTAFPGEPGNFAVAGHRVGKGAPFNDLDLLRSCDALVVETQQNWAVYRVLPMRSEIAGWATGRGSDPRCDGVQPLGGLYSGLVGQRIVLPSRSGVIAAIPDRPEGSFESLPSEDRVALITLTTCHPRFSAEKRLVLHGVFVKGYPKDPANPDARPPELTEG